MDSAGAAFLGWLTHEAGTSVSTKTSYQLVLLRHGESEWNKKNLFTGWRDVRLTEQGEREAREAGRTMKAAGLEFDAAHTSLLGRAIKTLWLALEEMDRMWLPVAKHWRLNERHYGQLQGSNKKEAVAKFGEAQVKIWRRSYATPPPPVDPDSPEYPKSDLRYAALSASELPRSESLKDVLARVMPYWEGTILPELKSGKRLLIAAHGNSLRAIVKHLENIGDEDIAGLDIPTGIPRAYTLDAAFKAAEVTYLGDPAELERRIGAVKAQTG
ncbi:MAG: 2,3-diphosphoglycerate-dependent phosphoglycerate mutase [Alphaproteobacteria bacterium]|nr:2,3-diphosphoglycerate-dependent phosphoglycerate mutase [Alphaproteobacteria bacterium]MBV9695271.1 2,3-diphosphoglycerate-dependent phosphoglycerate mutase [Alphaproteobacteria bacterium]